MYVHTNLHMHTYVFTSCVEFSLKFHFTLGNLFPITHLETFVSRRLDTMVRVHTSIIFAFNGVVAACYSNVCMYM